MSYTTGYQDDDDFYDRSRPVKRAMREQLALEKPVPGVTIPEDVHIRRGHMRPSGELKQRYEDHLTRLNQLEYFSDPKEYEARMAAVKSAESDKLLLALLEDLPPLEMTREQIDAERKAEMKKQAWLDSKAVRLGRWARRDTVHKVVLPVVTGFIFSLLPIASFLLNWLGWIQGIMLVLWVAVTGAAALYVVLEDEYVPEDEIHDKPPTPAGERRKPQDPGRRP